MRAAILILVVLSQVCSRFLGAPEDARKLLEMGAAGCESEMAFLDVLANNLSEQPDLRAYVLIYGGRKDTKRDEVHIRGARMQRYLVETRGITTTRVEVIDGGYRERFTVELWLVPKGAESPVASPTVKLQQVRFKKGRMERFREPGCFPGKYVVTKARHA
jgi:hypothetical protein